MDVLLLVIAVVAALIYVVFGPHGPYSAKSRGQVDKESQPWPDHESGEWQPFARHPEPGSLTKLSGTVTEPPRKHEQP